MIIVVDVDGTIFESEKIGDRYQIRAVNTALIDKINKDFYDGNEIIIYTARHWNQLDYTKKQLDEYGVKYTTIVLGKPCGDIFIDDRAVHPTAFLNGIK